MDIYRLVDGPCVAHIACQATLQHNMVDVQIVDRVT